MFSKYSFCKPQASRWLRDMKKNGVQGKYYNVNGKEHLISLKPYTTLGLSTGIMSYMFGTWKADKCTYTCFIQTSKGH